jgi:hypothetical protein
LTNIVKSAIGLVAATELQLAYCTIDSKTIAAIDVGPGAEPTFVTFKNTGKSDAFPVRTNNSTEELTGQALFDYKAKRWPG